MADFFAGQIPTAQQLDDTALVGTVVAQLRRTTTQSFASGTPTPIGFDTEDYDVLGGHSTVTNPSRYTCQREGWYLLIGGVGFDVPSTAGTNTYRGCRWRLNGADLNGSQQLIPPVPSVPIVGTVVSARPYMVYLVVGDFVELAGEHNCTTITTSGTTVLQPTMQVQYAGLPN